MSLERTSWNEGILRQESRVQLLTTLLRERYPSLANAAYLKAITLADRARWTEKGEELPEIYRQNSQWLEELIKETQALLGSILRGDV